MTLAVTAVAASVRPGTREGSMRAGHMAREWNSISWNYFELLKCEDWIRIRTESLQVPRAPPKKYHLTADLVFMLQYLCWYYKLWSSMNISVVCTVPYFTLLLPSVHFNAQWNHSHASSPCGTPAADRKPDSTFVFLKTDVERLCIVFCFLVPAMWCDVSVAVVFKQHLILCDWAPPPLIKKGMSLGCQPSLKSTSSGVAHFPLSEAKHRKSRLTDFLVEYLVKRQLFSLLQVLLHHAANTANTQKGRKGIQ